MNQNDALLYEAACILISGNSYLESKDAYKIDEARAILEDSSSPTTSAYYDALFSSVINKAHIDFGDIPNSKGDISSYIGYQPMIDTLSTIKALGAEQKVKDVIDYASVVEEAISHIMDLSSIYKQGFAEKVPYIALEYNTWVYNCVQATTALLYNFVEYIKEPNNQVMTIKLKNTKLRADEFFFEQLNKFNAIQTRNGTAYRKMLEEMLSGGKNNFLGSDRIVGIAAIGAIAFAVVPVTRALIYQIYKFRTNLSEELEIQAKFLEMNRTCLENNNTLDAKRKSEVIDKQKKLSSELRKLSEKIKVKSSKSIIDSKREIQRDNKSLTMDSIRQNINDSPLELF